MFSIKAHIGLYLAGGMSMTVLHFVLVFLPIEIETMKAVLLMAIPILWILWLIHRLVAMIPTALIPIYILIWVASAHVFLYGLLSMDDGRLKEKFHIELSDSVVDWSELLLVEVLFFLSLAFALSFLHRKQARRS
ncbi:MAG: hypothetical protein CVV45_03700 [Spirochaetae bacterium HGW-Spirochaetae-10]|nr:MAG: hypothetical protein CVV45_03700 [Spirochaetae bacterium HGW-Spirochaetae-10]